jgi:hypothetical protein
LVSKWGHYGMKSSMHCLHYWCKVEWTIANFLYTKIFLQVEELEKHYLFSERRSQITPTNTVNFQWYMTT